MSLYPDTPDPRERDEAPDDDPETALPIETSRDLRSALETSLQDALTDEMISRATEKFRNAVAEIESDLTYSIQSDLAYNLAAWTYSMFEQAIESMLKGDESAMRRHLSCQEGSYTGRDRNHSVIHGRLFETGAIELRKKIVNAHPELLKSERILDLEDQVKSLVAQVHKLERDCEDLRRNNA